MIYIDPPYNTGNEFVYKDDFKDNVKNYKEQTGQHLRANPETAGRFHTDWLNMMYPRLMLSRNLLTDDGLIFVSIDENEFNHLQTIMNEIYSKNNYIGTLIWKNRTTPNDSSTNFANIHEYVLIYAKNVENVFLKGKEKNFDHYKNPDNDPNGKWIRDNPSAASGNENNRLPIVNPFTKEKYYPPKGRYWAFSMKRIEEWTKSGKLVFPKEKGKNFLLKKYLNELKSLDLPNGSIYEESLTMHGTREFRSLFNDYPDLFKYPKPSKFVEELISYIDSDDFIVLDFFSGSSTTAQAVMNLNAKDNGKRKFIMVQLPELIDSKDKIPFKTIADVGRERIRRASKSIIDNLDKSTNDKTNNSLDVGFKVFKLDSTNIIPWDSSIKLDEKTIFDHSDVIKPNRTKKDVLYELMLKFGVFDMPVKEVMLDDKIIYDVGKGYLIVCLEENISLDEVTKIGKLKPANVIFDEKSFANDNDKINAVYTLQKLGVKEVKTI